MSETTVEEVSLHRVKIPKNKLEERALKNGLIEDDNEDIAYLNFKIIWPVSICSAVSILFLILSYGLMEKIDHVLSVRFATNQLWLKYGKTPTLCTDKYPYEEGMWPSLLRQVEIKVLTNIFFRIAVVVPMAVRIFLAMIVRNSLRKNEGDDSSWKSSGLRFMNELSVVLAVVEVFSQGIFSIVTIRFDFPQLYQYSFTLFVLTSAIYMFSRTVLLYTLSDDCEYLDTLSIIIKAFCTLVYSWTVPQLGLAHIQFIRDPLCHGYVPKGQAIIEYLAILSYLIYHLTNLIDIRDIRFLCYPRTCSGECEPLKPENFEEGQKYECCRSYELRQRQLLGQSL